MPEQEMGNRVQGPRNGTVGRIPNPRGYFRWMYFGLSMDITDGVHCTFSSFFTIRSVHRTKHHHGNGPLHFFDHRPILQIQDQKHDNLEQLPGA
jgi:hypothetical protein